MQYMKLKSIFFAATALTLAACSNESETGADALVALTVNANIEEQVTSRATETAFEIDDAIGISVTSTSTETATTGTNVKYVSSDGSKFAVATNVDPIYFKDNKTVSFSAYYPYSADVTSSSTTLSPSTKYQDKQAEFDFLYGTGSGDISSSAKGGIEMSFKHVMSKLTFTLAAGTGIGNETTLKDGLSAKYKISGLIQDGSFDTAKGVATTSTSATTVDDWEIFLPTTEDGNISSLVSSLILYPQSPGTLTIALTFNNVTYTASVTAPSSGFTAGNNYTYTLTLNQTGLTVSKSTITAWSTQNQTGVNAEYEYPDAVLDSGYSLSYGEEETLTFKGDSAE
jgi:hypothetical protein